MKTLTQRLTSLKGKRNNDREGPRCVHCKERKASQQRNLCNVCCRVPEVRTQYPYRNIETWDGGGGDFRSQAALQALAALESSVALPDRPTNAIPGSRAKMKVMAERLALKQSLFHPKDVGCFSYNEEYTRALTLHCVIPSYMTSDSIIPTF